jgi:coproporphyrinogen III oxidase
MREDVERMLREQQQRLCERLERVDGAARFGRDAWQRAGGGGGLTRVLEGGRVFERAGVNHSTVFGDAPDSLRPLLSTVAGGGAASGQFFVTSLSTVIHPRNPMVPTIHANYRYFEVVPEVGATSWWFAGGTDLTPSYLFAQDAREFHDFHRRICDAFDPAWYPRFKQSCDDYFFLPHRGEHRGIGGIFFDRLDDRAPRELFDFVTRCAAGIGECYLPIVERRREQPFADAQRAWQLLRRGRYVEFNLMYDRGTTFGLRTNGRVESILMSLPPLAGWSYAVQAAQDSAEAALQEVLRTPRDWASAAGEAEGDAR